MVDKAPIMNMVKFNGYYGCPNASRKASDVFVLIIIACTTERFNVICS